MSPAADIQAVTFGVSANETSADNNTNVAPLAQPAAPGVVPLTTIH